jgi:hypothetical protein
MEIYRVPGSVSFLHSGALLHAILPRSQCWCVDGVSKFAFRVLPDTYYRIELPGETAEDLELVDALKVTLKKVLFYERTPCPFARGFTVELPAEEVKIKKSRSVREGPAKKWRLEKTYSWKPEGWEEEQLARQLEGKGSQPSVDKRSGPSDEEDAQSDPSEEEEERRMHATTVTPSKSRPTTMGSMRSVTAPSQVQTSQTLPSRVRSRVQAVENVDRAQKAERVRFSDQLERQTSLRTKRLSAVPVDLPPSPPDSSTGAETHLVDDLEELSVNPKDASNEADEEVAPSERDTVVNTDNVEAAPMPRSDVESGADSNDTRNTQSENAMVNEPDTPQSFATRTSLVEPPIDAEQRDCSEEAARCDVKSLFEQLGETSLLPSRQHEPTKNEQNEHPSTKSASTVPAPREVTEDPYAAINARIQARRSIGGSTTSFQPSSNPPISKSSSSNASSVSIPSQRPKKSSLAQRNHSITAALVNKACAVFLGPPAHLVTMMLRIAARFSSGAFGSNSMFFVESPLGSPRRIPGSFYLEDEVDGRSGDEDWAEDDFGVPLKSPVRLSGLRERARRHGWELE